MIYNLGLQPDLSFLIHHFDSSCIIGLVHAHSQIYFLIRYLIIWFTCCFRYSIDVFQPPVKPELPKLHSQPSSSSLSNSSQSSGSLNSLDSQSSFSSSCTITGNPEQELEDTERCPSEPCSSGDSLVAQAGSMSSIQTTSSQSSLSSQNLLDTASGGGDSQFSAEESDLDDSAKSFPAASAENLNLAPDSELNNSAHIEQGPSGINVKNSSGKTVPMKPVLGLQSDDVDRYSPLFYIKPVTSDGVGIKAADGERLSDKGNCCFCARPPMRPSVRD